MHAILQEIQPSIADWTIFRRDLHQHPETGFAEHRTSRLVAEKLKEFGYEVDQGMAKTGVVGTLKCGNGSKTLGIRADIDALPMTENSGKPWASQHTEKFHGCGHDGHTTILLCAAEFLARRRNFNGTLNLIFQPAEELLYGGRVMLEDGLLEKFPCDALFGLHNMPGMPVGTFHFRKQAMMASCDTVHITVSGTGGHGAIPEKTVDATLVACQIAVALQTIVSRNVTPFAQAVITVGSIHSGEAPNIINEKAVMKLSVRSLDPQVRQLLLKRIDEVARLQAESFNAVAKVEHINGCPVLINDDAQTEFAISVARELVDESQICTDASALMGSEDFAFMLEANPNGAYLMVGNGPGPMVHNPGYDFNDEIILPAAAYWCLLAERYLQ
ncbi:M20 aminoacylase family protein [Kalamiella sp. sgz302252]|uniref:M20 aminoacylase family protein n=1 Tax=Pantoea sp. sgz302252 TaxID=3341827 RepID=UPI0036D2C0D8